MTYVYQFIPLNTTTSSGSWIQLQMVMLHRISEHWCANSLIKMWSLLESQCFLMAFLLLIICKCLQRTVFDVYFEVTFSHQSKCYSVMSSKPHDFLKFIVSYLFSWNEIVYQPIWHMHFKISSGLDNVCVLRKKSSYSRVPIPSSNNLFTTQLKINTVTKNIHCKNRF